MKAKKKNLTFMQQYRQWRRSGSTRRARSDRHCIDRYGYSMALAFDRYNVLCHSNTNCTIHTRVNFRGMAAAQLGEAWHRQSPDLNRRWRSWEYHPAQA